MGNGNRKTEHGGADKPFRVRAKLGRPPGPVASAERPSDPIFFDAPGPVMGMIADAKLTELKRQTAAALLVGHIRLLSQVLGLTPDDEYQAMARAVESLFKPAPPAPPVDVGPLDAVDLPPSGSAGG